MKIYKISDRIKIKIGDIVVKVSPLSFAQKSEIQADLIKFQQSKDIKDLMDSSFKAIKYAVKEIENIDYQLEFEGNVLTDACVEDLLNCEINNQLVAACIAFLNGVPNQIINAETGKPLEGIEILPLELTKPSRKRAS